MMEAGGMVLFLINGGAWFYMVMELGPYASLLFVPMLAIVMSLYSFDSVANKKNRIKHEVTVNAKRFITAGKASPFHRSAISAQASAPTTFFRHRAVTTALPMLTFAPPRLESPSIAARICHSKSSRCPVPYSLQRRHPTSKVLESRLLGKGCVPSSLRPSSGPESMIPSPIPVSVNHSHNTIAPVPSPVFPLLVSVPAFPPHLLPPATTNPPHAFNNHLGLPSIVTPPSHQSVLRRHRDSLTTVSIMTSRCEPSWRHCRDANHDATVTANPFAMPIIATEILFVLHERGCRRGNKGAVGHQGSTLLFR
ncbi:hypothetical protein E2542_SST16625 [Spatholobus suberectus]|nr:hypothetical protein E2542_SST16625 [Spatholobus suberectus]